MAGRFREDDIAEVREKVRIEEVVSSYVTLRNAGGGSLKGLCPFHDEKTPSFNVNPGRNFYHCFGCQEGGDAIAFVQKIDGLSFVEAIERLADLTGVQLRREEGDDEPRGPRGPGRQRLVEAHTVAEAFYREQRGGPEALEARRFLDSRGFDQAAAEQFGVGFAPRDGDALLRHLRGRRFTDEESVAAGLVAQGRSAYDRFRGRLLWPIRDAGGDTIGFGARRIFDDDRIDAKYLNTPETQIYKKSRVLYGLDLARKSIGLHSQAVIVEGYTDVMACHLAGVPTAIATCGTAFGEDHTKMLRRFLHDHDEFKGEVIFTFDGDEAGQRAAVKAFSLDQSFVSQTYVAVEKEGRDPCDLRLAEGEEAVRDLVATRTPLYRFVLGNVVSRYDLDRADGRVDALREAASLVTSIRDRSKVDAFVRELAQMVGVDPDEARAQVRRASTRDERDRQAAARQAPEAPTGAAAADAPPRREAPPPPDPRDPRFALERETLKLVVQHPGVLGRTVDDLDVDDFTHPVYRGVWEAVAASGGARAGTGDAGWASRLSEAATDPTARSTVSALSVERIPVAGDPTSSYAHAHVTRLQELTVLRRIQAVKSRLQRTNPVEQQTEYNRMFGELVALEQQRRTLRDRLVAEQ